MKPLPILWKRLVDEGETCPRCGSTQRNVMAAVARLEPALRPLGVQPVLETQAIDDATFRDAPAESNRIWIGGRPMEDWLGARAGHSPCCEVCGDLPCRTMEVDGQTYEAIPEDLIVNAALIAASRLIGPEAAAATSSCCSTGCGGNRPRDRPHAVERAAIDRLDDMPSRGSIVGPTLTGDVAAR